MNKSNGSIGRSSGDPAALMGSALAAHRAGRMAEAVALYDRVLGIDKRHPGATHLKGVAMLQAGRLDDAQGLLARAIRLRPGNGAAHSDLGICLMRMGRAADAASALATAAKLMPEAAAIQANRGHALAMLGRHAEALAAFERAARLDPGTPDFAVHQAAALTRLDRTAEALIAVGRVLAAVPGHPLALKVRGDIAAVRGDGEDAGRRYDLAIAAAPDFADARLARGGLRLDVGDGAGALADFDHVLGLLPELPEAHAGRGAALLMIHRPLEAVTSLHAAVATSGASPDARANLALALLLSGQPETAIDRADEELRDRPDSATLWLCRGNALAQVGRLEEALQSFDRVLALKPHDADATYEKAGVLRRLNRGAEAIALCRALLASAPEHFEARWLAVFAAIPAVAGSADAVVAARREVESGLDELEAHAGEDDAWQAVGRVKPFYLTYHERDNRPLLQRYGSLCHRLMAQWQSRTGVAMAAPVSEPVSGRRIRIGIIGSDFCHHSIWTAITKGWLTGLDRSRFEVHAFHTGGQPDMQTEIARRHVDGFVQGARGLEAWARAIVQTRPDILIYPEIGVDPVSLRLASLRLAPVQATTWGHPDTSGLPSIDAYLSGEAFEPAGAQAHYSERLVTLPGFGVSYGRLGVTPAAFDPVAFGLPADAPILVSPGTPFKYAPEHDRVLVEIARRIGRVSIVMFEPSRENQPFFDRLRERLASAFAAAGLDMAGCVHVLPWLKPSQFHGLMVRADGFLDTIGFSGFNTAMQAVECGLPIVTREGRFLRGRLASAIYREMGMAEAVAADEEAYIAMAVRLATEPAFRDGLRGRIEAARDPLFDDPRPVAALENWLEAQCEQHGRGESFSAGADRSSLSSSDQRE